MIIHVFNPEHDMALAANSPFWTSPHAGRKLKADLGWIPALWAQDGDVVIVDDVQCAESSYQRFKFEHKPAVAFATLAQLRSIDLSSCDAICPWGWDVTLTQQFKRNGVRHDLLPSAEHLARQREISDRATSARLLASLIGSFDGLCGIATAIDNISDITALEQKWGSVVLKSPWSCSGRGVRYLSGDYNNIIRWAEKVVKTQGHLMVEPFLEKVMDFGMEFTATSDGTVRYDGLSLFHTVNGAYEGSVLATEQEKEAILANYVSIDLVTAVQQHICQWMQKEIGGAYVGPFGVDMMICRGDGDTLLIQPCVEINLRRTMGHVALALSPKEECKQQLMRVGYENTSYHLRIINDHELYY